MATENSIVMLLRGLTHCPQEMSTFFISLLCFIFSFVLQRMFPTLIRMVSVFVLTPVRRFIFVCSLNQQKRTQRIILVLLLLFSVLFFFFGYLVSFVESLGL